jgi:hypothetical protein
METWPPDRVAAGLRVLAQLHGPTWGWAAERLSWLTVGTPTVRAVGMQLLQEPHWSSHFAHPDAPRLPPELNDSALLIHVFKALWAYDDSTQHCIAHGDAHVGNTYLSAGGAPSFIDWQMPCLAPWSSDVSYFVAGALSVEDRRAHERDLLKEYLAALAAAGGPTLAWGDAWDDYGRHQIHGLLWAVNDPTMQPLERTRPMTERYVAAVLDHDSVAALERIA